MMPAVLPGVLLDTNVLSELMRARPDAAVLARFAQQSGLAFYTSAITRAEIFLGIALLPDGKRKEALAAAAKNIRAGNPALMADAYPDSYPCLPPAPFVNGR